MKTLPQDTLKQLFTEGRTHHGWSTESVPDSKLRELYELMKWAPTCVNGAPARVVFVKTPEMKEKLVSCLMEKNINKTRAAPVTAIIAYDRRWYEHLPKLFPQTDYRSIYAGNIHLNETTAFRNSSLQGGYLILAARSLGLDVGPMSGFDIEKLNTIFFNETNWRVNFLCNLGYGNSGDLYPRGPRLDFAQVCTII